MSKNRRYFWFVSYKGLGIILLAISVPSFFIVKRFDMNPILSSLIIGTSVAALRKCILDLLEQRKP